MVQGIGSSFTDPNVKLRQETADQDQAYTVSAAKSETPAAASGVQSDSFEKKGGKKAGKVIGVIVAAAAVVAGLIYGANNSGKIREHLPEFIKKSEFANKCLHGLKVAGTKLGEYANKGIDAIKKLFHRAAEEVKTKTEDAKLLLEEAGKNSPST